VYQPSDAETLYFGSERGCVDLAARRKPRHVPAVSSATRRLSLFAEWTKKIKNEAALTRLEGVPAIVMLSVQTTRRSHAISDSVPQFLSLRDKYGCGRCLQNVVTIA
jgi:hypothetical protein